MPSIVVTGATHGIGRAIALLFAKNHFNVAICARNEDDLDHLATKLREQNKEIQLIAQKCDVSLKNDLQSFADRILNEWESVDVLVNNAGIFLPGKILDEEDGAFEKMMHTNLFSAYHFSRMILPSMVEKGKGHLFNMCSTASITAYENGGTYCISKHAQYGLHRVLREELKNKNIKVTAIMPGPTYTRSWEEADIPEERFMKADDVAKSVFSAYNLSPSANVEEIVMRPIEGDL